MAKKKKKKMKKRDEMAPIRSEGGLRDKIIFRHRKVRKVSGS